MITVAATGDLHMGADVRGRYRPGLRQLAERADVLLVAGDLTQHGTVHEGRVVADELAGLGLPVVAVLGNHDYHGDRQEEITATLNDAGIIVLEGDGVVIDCPGGLLGVGGTKGFGGGFAGRCATEFGEPEMKAFVRHTKDLAGRYRAALRGLRADHRTGQRADHVVALTHYAPVDGTLGREPPEIYPFLGSYLLAEAIDAAGCSLAVHGHAHLGREKGTTPGGVPVRNVAVPVLGAAYAVYSIGSRGKAAGRAAVRATAISRQRR